MIKKPFAFDTLEYAKMLEEGGVENANIHSSSLSKAIIQNIYTKDEVDKMIEAALKRFDTRTRIISKRLDKRTHDLKMEMKALENRIEKKFNDHLVSIISILGSLIVLTGAVVTFSHYFIH